MAALRDRYYLAEERVQQAAATRRSFNLIHLATMMKVDVFVSRERPFDRSAFERLTPEVLDAARPARTYPVPRAEDVVLLKLEWFRAGGEISDRQWGDIVGVIRVAGAALDRDYLTRWAADLAVSDLLEGALDRDPAERQRNGDGSRCPRRRHARREAAFDRRTRGRAVV